MGDDDFRELLALSISVQRQIVRLVASNEDVEHWDEDPDAPQALAHLYIERARLTSALCDAIVAGGHPWAGYKE